MWGLLLKAIPGRVMVEAGVLLVLGAMLWVSRAEVSHLRMRAETAEASAKQALAAYRSEAATVATQAAALTEWARKAAEAEAASQNALSDAADAKAKLAAAAINHQKELANDRARPDCAAMLRSDLAPVCPAHARWLLAPDHLPRPGGPSGGARTGAAGPG